MQLIN